jgi:hypothetical protein
MPTELAAHILAVAINLCVGVPVLRRGLRQADPPIALLGASVVLNGVQWLLWMLASLSSVEGTQAGDALAIACRAGISVSVVCMLAFTRIAFRPSSRATGIAVWAAAAALAIAFVGEGAVGDWGGYRNDHAWIWLEVLVQLAAYAWCAFEPLSHYRGARRRVAYGLAEPETASRLLLWGLFAAMFFLSQAGYCLTLAWYEDLTTLDAALVGLDVTGGVALWCAFHPPRLLLRVLSPASRVDTAPRAQV